MCKFVPRKKERKNIINQFVIPERDKTVFPDIETAVRDALSRSFLDITIPNSKTAKQLPISLLKN